MNSGCGAVSVNNFMCSLDVGHAGDHVALTEAEAYCDHWPQQAFKVIELSAIELGPKDVIVIHCQEPISLAGRERLRQMVEAVWPGRKAVVMDGGLKLGVLRETAPELPDTDPSDSDALRRLRQIIDSEIGWDNEHDEEHGDYEARLKQVAQRRNAAKAVAP